MIVSPKTWDRIGQKVSLDDIDRQISHSVTIASCNNLSLSGGLDSSLLLYYLTEIHGKDVNCYTIAKNKEHPDYIYSKLVAEHFGVNLYFFACDVPLLQDGLPGDGIVKIFYDNLSKLAVSEIISGDGIDEYMCGYYDHQNNPSEEVYFDRIWRLNDEHLAPLDRNSGDIKVYLPYLESRLLLLFSQIPISEKVDSMCRKKMMVQLAEGRILKEIIERRKYGFCDAMTIKAMTGG